jgi:hypothetical protein
MPHLAPLCLHTCVISNVTGFFIVCFSISNKNRLRGIICGAIIHLQQAFPPVHVFPGEKVLLTEGTADSNDILVVNSGSYNKLYGEAGAKYLGRLVRFENLRVCYVAVTRARDELYLCM